MTGKGPYTQSTILQAGKQGKWGRDRSREAHCQDDLQALPGSWHEPNTSQGGPSHRQKRVCLIQYYRNMLSQGVPSSTERCSRLVAEVAQRQARSKLSAGANPKVLLQDSNGFNLPHKLFHRQGILELPGFAILGSWLIPLCRVPQSRGWRAQPPTGPPLTVQLSHSSHSNPLQAQAFTLSRIMLLGNIWNILRWDKCLFRHQNREFCFQKSLLTESHLRSGKCWEPCNFQNPALVQVN